MGTLGRRTPTSVPEAGRHDSVVFRDANRLLIAYRPEVEVHEGLRRTAGWFVGQRAPTPVGD
jgi:hypothetical protein